jgi:hypothetical protein
MVRGIRVKIEKRWEEMASEKSDMRQRLPSELVWD